MVEPSRHLNGFRFRLSIAFGRWAPARPSTKRFVFGEILADGRARFKPSSRGVWGAAAPQENVRTQLTEPPKTKRLVDGRACAHRPNAINKRTNKEKYFQRKVFRNAVMSSTDVCLRDIFSVHRYI